MTERELLDISFNFLYSRQKEHITYKSLESHITDKDANPVRLLNSIYNMGFLDKELNTQQTQSHNNNIYNYSINSKRINFIETMPDEFKDKPYSYHLKIDADKQKIQNERDEIDYKIKQITLKNIPTNKNIALWSLMVAVIAILAPIIASTINGNKIIKTESTIKDLNKIQQTQEQELQVLKDVLDSLRRN